MYLRLATVKNLTTATDIHEFARRGREREMCERSTSVTESVTRTDYHISSCIH